MPEYNACEGDFYGVLAVFMLVQGGCKWIKNTRTKIAVVLTYICTVSFLVNLSWVCLK